MTAIQAGMYRQYRAPANNGTSLIEPSLPELVAALGQPAPLSSGAQLEFCGKPLDVVRRQARQEVIELATAYTGQYLPVDETHSETQPIILSGHQPELFHPGVWFKNFLLSSLGQKSSAIAINFLVDNDICRRASIRVPTETAAGISVTDVPFDASRDAIPWELRRLGSMEQWSSFPQRVLSTLPDGAALPLVQQLWSDATQAVRQSDRPGPAIAQARHRLERQAGLRTLEVPLSQLVSTRAFARFSIQLLSELPRFQTVYNEQLQRYRAAHRIRNHAHPVPALEQQDGWLEAPWWIYRNNAPRRQRLWVRLLDEQLMLCDRAGWQATIDGRLDCDNAASQWLELLADGVCLRPRALLTTMYLRILIGDLFVHGIGGAKYDQLTDAIIRDFLGVEPPPMCVATATLQLPLSSIEPDQNHDAEAQIREHKKQLWELRFHAERAADASSSEALTLAARKRDLLANIPPKGQKWDWHREMSAINARLRGLAAEQTQAAQSRVRELAASQRQQRIEQSREYSFCLYPLEFITDHLAALAEA